MNYSDQNFTVSPLIVTPIQLCHTTGQRCAPSWRSPWTPYPRTSARTRPCGPEQRGAGGTRISSSRPNFSAATPSTLPRALRLLPVLDFSSLRLTRGRTFHPGWGATGRPLPIRFLFRLTLSTVLVRTDLGTFLVRRVGGRGGSAGIRDSYPITESHSPAHACFRVFVNRQGR